MTTERWDVQLVLTPRQYEVLELLANGHTQQQVAAHLGISHETVRTHTKDIRRRLDARNMAHASLLFGEDRYSVRHRGQLPKHGLRAKPEETL
jgi:DNA-binding CsgD family transcriptional regulator